MWLPINDEGDNPVLSSGADKILYLVIDPRGCGAVGGTEYDEIVGSIQFSPQRFQQAALGHQIGGIQEDRGNPFGKLRLLLVQCRGQPVMFQLPLEPPGLFAVFVVITDERIVVKTFVLHMPPILILIHPKTLPAFTASLP